MPAQPEPTTGDPPVVGLILAFLAVYLIWGSTFLAIYWAIDTIPPFTMAGIRFVIAGSLLAAWAEWSGIPRPTPTQIRDAAVVGTLLLVGGNGAVVFAEQFVPSGLTALLIATVPFWMVLLDWLWTGGRRPSAGSWFGLAWGLFGVWLLVGGEAGTVLRGPGLLGALAILGGSISWAFGSIHSRRIRVPAAPRWATAVQMLASGTLLGVAGAVMGEWGRWNPGETSLRSLLALVYLIVFGGMVAYSAYVWLLRVSTPGRVSTYAYVNPVVALFLGWALADETVTPRTLVAAAVILSAVVLLGRVSATKRASPDRDTSGVDP